jgi:hypothetical protein
MPERQQSVLPTGFRHHSRLDIQSGSTAVSNDATAEIADFLPHRETYEEPSW